MVIILLSDNYFGDAVASSLSVETSVLFERLFVSKRLKLCLKMMKVSLKLSLTKQRTL